MKVCDITLHAIEQFISRFEPRKSNRAAEEELQALYRTSRKLGKTPLGDQIVASSYRPDVRLVIKDLNVCVTVLPPSKQAEVFSEEDYKYLDDFENIFKQKIIKEFQDDIDEYNKELSEIMEKLNNLNNRRCQLKTWISSKTREVEVLIGKSRQENNGKK